MSRFGSERDERLGSRPAVGAEPDALYTRYLRPVPEQRRGEVAAARRLAVIAADDTLDDALFPPSPALRIKWRRVAGWTVLLLVSCVGAATIARLGAQHWRGAVKATYITAAAGYLLYLTRRTDR